MAFASPADLAQFLQTATQEEADAGDPNVLDTAIAQAALDSATAAIVAVCGWPIEAQANAVETFPLATSVSLTTLMLTAVHSVATAAQTVPTDRYYWDASGVIEFYSLAWAGQVINTSRVLPWPPRITVTYDHGYATVPEVIKTVCLEISAYRYINPTNLASASRLGVSEQYRRSANDSTDLQTDPRLDPYRRPTL